VKKRGERFLGPYEQPKGWRVIEVDAANNRTSSMFETEARARRYIEMMRADAEACDHTTETAFAEYKAYLAKKATKPQSIATTERAIGQFFPEPIRLKALTEKKCQALYDDLTTRPSELTGKPFATDTHRNALSQAKSFLAWCAAPKRAWLTGNPLQEVEGIGARRPRGKSLGKAGNELHIKQTRAWYTMAVFKAQGGDQGAVAALVALLLGLRPSEIVARLVADVDENTAPGDVLWIPCSKTPAGKRTIDVPPELAPLLATCCEGRDATARLFAGKKGRPHTRNWIKEQVHRLCDLAEVPRVTAYFMRGQLATISAERGMAGHLIAAMMGHESEATTMHAYAKPGSAAAGARRLGWSVLDGGVAK
jgi:integrase